MKKAFSFAMAIALAFIFCACVQIKPGNESAAPSVTETASPSPTASSNLSIIPDTGKTSRRAWRYHVSIQTDTEEHEAIQNGCKTTYDTVKTVNIQDAGLRTWVDGQLQAFINGVIQDTGIIDKTKTLFHEKGLDAKYPGSTFLRRVTPEVSGTGSILSLKVKDHCVFRPTDADIVKYNLGYMNIDETTAWYNYEDSFAYYTGDGDDEFEVPEAYSYTVKTLCLDLAGRKPLALSDLFKPGADFTDAVNREITRQMLKQRMEEDEVLKRPFTGISKDHDAFFIQSDFSRTSLQMIFNEGSPFFNFNAVRDWCAYRYFSINTDELAYMLTPLLRDDSLLQSFSTMPPQSDYAGYFGASIGDKYMPNTGFGRYERENGGSSIRAAQTQNPGVKDTLNQGIADFERMHVSRENMLHLQGLDQVASDGAVVSIHAAAKEAGPFLTVSYDADISCSEGYGSVRIEAAFDLNTGKRLTFRDLLKEDYLQDMEYKKISSDLLENYVTVGKNGSVYAYYQRAPAEDMEGEMELPTAYALLDLSKYFDLEKWAATSSPAYDPGEPALPVYPAAGVSEERWGYITKAYTSNGMATIEIDYVDLYKGAEAISKAAEDGKTPDANGMYVRNTNTKVRTFPLSHWCSIMLTDMASPDKRQKEVSWAELADGLNVWTDPLLVHIYVNKGYVTRMNQRIV